MSTTTESNKATRRRHPALGSRIVAAASGAAGTLAIVAGMQLRAESSEPAPEPAAAPSAGITVVIHPATTRATTPNTAASPTPIAPTATSAPVQHLTAQPRVTTVYATAPAPAAQAAALAPAASAPAPVAAPAPAAPAPVTSTSGSR